MTPDSRARRPGTIVVGIPTYKRPRLLEDLLVSLLPEARAVGATILVADNECGVDAPEVTRRMRPADVALLCAAVPERGLAQVRNALVAQATQHCPDWAWLVMLDDDGQVTPGWLTRLLQTGEQHQAHLVGGPVQGVLPVGASALARNSIFAARRRWPTGPVDCLNTTQNLAISRRTLALMKGPLFRDELGASGGEDYDLFRRVARAGGLLAWCDEAVVIEPAPAERLRMPALLHRYATTGMYMAVIDSTHDGRPAAWRQALVGLAGSMARTLGGALRLDANATAQGVLSVSHQVGRIGGMLGLRSARYVQAPAASATRSPR